MGPRRPIAMDLTKALAELKDERERIEDAIMALTRLAEGRGPKRRGRPPAWMAIAPKKRGRPPGSKNKIKEKQEIGPPPSGG